VWCTTCSTFLRYNDMQLAESQQTFRRSISPPFAWSRNNPRSKPALNSILAWLFFRHWRWRRHDPPNHLLTFKGQDVISQKTELFITEPSSNNRLFPVKISEECVLSWCGTFQSSVLFCRTPAWNTDLIEKYRRLRLKFHDKKVPSNKQFTIWWINWSKRDS
jgi:hypothetical protein